MKAICTIAAGLLYTTALAQEVAERTLVAEAYAAGGAFLVRDGGLSINEWRAMLPGSSLLRDDLPARTFNYPWYGPSGFSGPGSLGPGITRSSAGVYLAVGLDLDRTAPADARFEKRLRAGITFGAAEQTTSTWARSLTGVYDTLVSQTTGTMYELDSTWTDSYIATVSRSRVALDGTFILRKTTQRRFSWYVGGGALLGLEHDARAEVSRTITRFREEGRNSSSFESNTLSEESFRLGPSLLLGAHALIGIDLRLGKTSPFWSSLHLFTEWRRGLLVSSFPGVAARLGSSTQQLIGLRVDLH